MSNVKNLFSTAITKIKAWVQESFDEMAKDMDAREAKLKADLVAFEKSMEEKMNTAIVSKFDAISLPNDGVGVESIDFGINEKCIVAEFSLTNGVISKKEFTLPIPIYRGVHKSENLYTPGDFVTFGGSLWHCNEENPGDKPGKSAAWTLAVKKGADAK